ncbi:MULTISPECIES: hypothetical protein [unclassified Enterobacter]|uniref:hypothetical protein n=1 Tax=unclassified Enterobacter TaxID=2608935 RepID=UPI000F48CDF7|nr:MULTISPECIES: hypothetical protein [unclassified Enterobacter]
MMMNGIENITAANTQSDSLLSNNDNTSAMRNNPKTAESNSDNNQKGIEESSTKITLSATDLEEINKQHELKVEEVKKTDYTLEMTGLPLFGGRLISIAKYPNGEEVIVDALSGRRLTAQELQDLSSAQQQVVDLPDMDIIGSVRDPSDL